MAGVVEAESCGRFTYYRLKPDVIANLAESAYDPAENHVKRSCP